jgi:serine/threonine protein phosphatase PrpC
MNQNKVQRLNTSHFLAEQVTYMTDNARAQPFRNGKLEHINETTTRKAHATKMPRHRTKKQTSTTPLLSIPFFDISRHTIACERHPERNEDSILIDANSGLFAVYDGVGGSAAGEIASQTAARATSQRWKHVLKQLQNGRKVPTFLEQSEKFDLCDILQLIIQDADEMVRTDGARLAGTDDLATTVALLAFSRSSGMHGYTMFHAHVGDSRIYLLHEKEPLKRLTSDDGLLAKLVENQIVSDEDALRIDQAMRSDQLTDTEYSYFRLRGGITQALGGPIPPSIHTDQVPIHPGDRILLCTDGIHDNLVDQEIEEVLRACPRKSAARVLVERSLERSHQERYTTVRAKPDDMSAIVLTCRF